MYNRNDPRFRRTLNQISSNLEQANESAQVGLFSLTEHCLKPCFSNLSVCLQQSGDACLTCFPPRDDAHHRRPRRVRTGRTRGGLEHSFDFYDNWQDDEDEALLALANDEHDRLLQHDDGGSRSPREPARRGVMNYGSVGRGTRVLGAKARKPTVLSYHDREDPTTIPNQSYFGFLDRLPFKIGAKNLRYKPSAAGLQERPRDNSRPDDKESSDGSSIRGPGANQPKPKHNRNRSDTATSQTTQDSYSSRGDIFPSDEEDDAIPLDDEFAVALERRSDDTSSAKTKRSKRRKPKQSRTPSSKSSRPSSRHSEPPDKDYRRDGNNSSSQDAEQTLPLLSDLKEEEQQVRREEEEDPERGQLGTPQRLDRSTPPPSDALPAGETGHEDFSRINDGL